MTRVSLKEAYDNKDVVAQIYAIRDTAESAVDTSEQAVTTANTASDHVDALVPQVEGAVENANSASASAQASAQTVAGYENRLGAVETGLSQTESDLNAVTLRVTTAEGNIVTIQGRVTALETADGQNVKLTGTHAIGNYAVLLTGNQEKSGQLVSLSEGGFQVTRSANYSIAFVQKNTGTDRDDNTQSRYLIPLWVSDVNDKQMVSLRYNKVNKTHRVFIRIVDSAGVDHDTVIAEYIEA